MTYYKTINGKRYDRTLMEKADELTRGRGDGRLSLDDAGTLLKATEDSGLITTTEVRTLRYILDHFPLTEKAHEWLWSQLRRQTPTQRSIRSVLLEIFGFDRMTWNIDDDVVEEHSALYENITSFPAALREMIDDFINGMESSTSVRDVISRESGVDLEDQEAITARAKALINKGVIFLFPPDYLERIREGEIDFKYPPFVHRVEEYWPFGLRLPDLKKYFFIGFVNRRDWWDVYHTGYR